MLRLLGAGLIIAGGTALGFYKSDRLLKHRSSLDSLITALELLKTDISYGKRDIKTILKTISEAQKLQLFSDISDNLYQISLYDSFKSALENRDTYISDNDIEILLTLAADLGKTDTQNQLKCISYAKCRLEESRSCAAEKYIQEGRLYRSLGVLTGAMAAIILL